jgi:3-hydroxyisobutyrate dehydrogenase-like beta-hydroxyacid dehydrogenase
MMGTTPPSNRPGGLPLARILILHPGEMGAAVGAALVDVGHEVVWIPDGRSAETRSRADRSGLRPTGDATHCDLVISVCPPAAASAVAVSVVDLLPRSRRPAADGSTSGGDATRDPGSAISADAVGAPAAIGRIYLDANAIAPSTAAIIASEVIKAGMRYVDGGIVGPPPARGGTTRLYLSGADAPAVSEMFQGARIEPRVIDGAGPTAASGIKMTYAAWSKISAALLITADAAAQRLDVREALRAEWALSQPDLTDRLDRALAAATAKGWRWEAEMREIAAAFDRVDLPDGYGLAAAETFSGFDRPGLVDEGPS